MDGRLFTGKVTGSVTPRAPRRRRCVRARCLCVQVCVRECVQDQAVAYLCCGVCARAGRRRCTFCERQTSFAASATNTRVNKPVPGGGAVTSLPLPATRLSVRIRIHFFLLSRKTRENAAAVARWREKTTNKKNKKTLNRPEQSRRLLTPALS